MKSQIGVIGLGVMGKSLALNMLDKGHAVSVYNRNSGSEAELLHRFKDEASNHDSVASFSEITPFLSSLQSPKIIMLMIKAGDAVDQVIELIKPQLQKGDVIIDGGNSNFKDTERRLAMLKDSGIHFVGSGISGGESGARNGPSIMPGGSKTGYELVSTILKPISASDSAGAPCCTHVGSGGAGHFVKMIHNGVEYAEMQLIAEVYSVFKKSMTNIEISNLFESWNKGDLSSYLLEITVDILRKTEDGHFLVDMVLDKAGNKGTGSWSSQNALSLGLPTTMMTDAVFARYISAQKELRQQIGFERKTNLNITNEMVENAYRFARIVNHAQGFEIIRSASRQFEWNVNLSEIARIWTNGCIIRSKFMEDCSEHFKSHKDIISSNGQLERLKSLEPSCIGLITNSLKMGLSTPVFSSAIQYWLGITTSNLPANLIQAQRDYFGAHTYQRIDDPSGSPHHSNWSSND